MSQLALARSEPEPETRKLLLIGNPNVGKSLLFTRLTNRYVTVSNYPGTTVEITTAKAELDGELREVIDTPGTNSLAPQSNDERVTRDLLLQWPDAPVVQVGDIGNLRRALLLSLQLAEHDTAFALCLNMSDESKETIDTEGLSEALGVPVVATSALRRWNIEKLQRAAAAPRRATISVSYGPVIEDAIRQLTTDNRQPRGLALSYLAGDDSVASLLADDAPRIRKLTAETLDVPLAVAIVNARLAAIDGILHHDAHRRTNVRGFRAWLGRVSMHPVWGIPILAGVLWVAYEFVGKFGAGTLVDFFEHTLFGRFLNPVATKAVDFAFGSVPFLRNLLVGEYGLITMALTYAIAIILPVVVTFFIFFGILEDSGYLPRLAVMLHRTFRRMGLNGKAVLPMVLGLGCDTMATLTTRILETKKEAVIVTLLLALGVPCSAQLGVILAMLGPLGLVAAATWVGVTSLTIFIVGWLAAKLVRGDSGDFILEVPPIRMPKLSNILIKVLARTEWYLKEAVPLFVIGTLLLYLLDAAHLLTAIQRALSPLVVGALGLPAEASNAFVVGFLRRDYGAAGLFAMQKAGQLTGNQTVVALTVMTLFIPCVANFLVIWRERGYRAGLAIAGFIVAYAFGIGALMHFAMRALGVTL
jgi:ferrous iron transport protein B